jgi:hypothetical protein
MSRTGTRRKTLMGDRRFHLALYRRLAREDVVRQYREIGKGAT